MTKLMIRLSVVTLVLAGAAASTFTPKTQATHAVITTPNVMVLSASIPVPSCQPGYTCGW